MGTTRLMDMRPLLVVALLAANMCGADSLPRRERTEAVTSMRAAHALGAGRSPEAAFQLTLATDELERARSLERRGRLSDAGRAYVRARFDAELAVALQREADARLGEGPPRALVAQASGAGRGTASGAGP